MDILWIDTYWTHTYDAHEPLLFNALTKVDNSFKIHVGIVN